MSHTDETCRQLRHFFSSLFSITIFSITISHHFFCK